MYIAIIAVCPLLSWGKTDGKTFWDRVKMPLLASVPVMGLFVWNWWVNLAPVYQKMIMSPEVNTREHFAMYSEVVYTIIAMVGAAIAIFLIMTNVFLFIRGTAARMKAKGENPLLAFWNVIWKARVQSGGYISHMAMGIIVVGMIGSVMYIQTEQFEISKEPGSIIEVSNYKFTLVDYTEQVLEETDNKEVQTTTIFDVERDGVKIGQMAPSSFFDPIRDSTRVNAAVKFEPLRDIYMTYGNVANENNVGITIAIVPLIWLVWIGFALLMAGNALSSIPKRQPKAELPAKKKSAKPKAGKK
jgi:cytochrome c-type biogenesis protein CcmF